MRLVVKGMLGAGFVLLGSVFPACATGPADVKVQARTAFEQAVATDTKNLNAISLPSNASDSTAQQAFSSLASESLRFKGEIQSITYPENAKADVDKFATDLGNIADFAQRISAVMGQLAAGTQPTGAPSATDFCAQSRQAVTDANAIFNDLGSSQQYTVPGIGCG